MSAVAGIQLPTVELGIDDGETVGFDRVLADRRGLVVGGRLHCWAELDRVHVEVHPRARFNGSRTDLRVADSVVPAGEVANLMTLLRLVRAPAGRRTP